MDIATHTHGAPSITARDKITEALNDGFTGLLRVEFADSKTMSLFAVVGRPVHVYIQNHRLPGLDWELELSHRGDGALAMKPLPVSGIRIEKILLEHLEPAAFHSTQTHQLRAMFEPAKEQPRATLFHIRWRDAEAFALTAGGNLPVQKFILLTGESAEEGTSILDQIAKWDEAQCTVATYHGDIKLQAWLEMHLNLLFEWSCSHILQQYAKLTGLVMIALIARTLRVNASLRGWMFQVNGTDLTDATIFATAAETGAAYREALASIEAQIEPIIGGGLTRALKEHVRSQPRHVYKTIGQIFLLDEEPA